MSRFPSRCRLGVLLVVTLAWLAVQVARAAGPVYYGGIEIGAKGIKVVALPIGKDGSPDLAHKIDRLPHKAVNNVTLGDLAPDGSYRTEAISEARSAVADFYNQLTRDLKVPPEHIFVVAGSGLTAKGEPPNFDALRKAVVEATGGASKLVKIDQATEVDLLIRGAIPRQDWGNAVLIDIGSGNVKCGYHHPKRGLHVETNYAVSDVIEGTVAYTKTIQVEMARSGRRGFADFCEAAERLRSKAVVEKVANQIARKPGLENRTRIYLSGGAPWAIVTLTNPVGSTRPDALIVAVPLDDIRKFRDELRRTGRVPVPDLSSVTDKNARNAAEEAVRDALDNFTKENLLAGAEILLGFADVLKWQELNKDVYFTRSGVVAWIVGFVEKAK